MPVSQYLLLSVIVTGAVALSHPERQHNLLCSPAQIDNQMRPQHLEPMERLHCNCDEAAKYVPAFNKVSGKIIGVAQKIKSDQEVEQNFRKTFISLGGNLAALINGPENIDLMTERGTDALAFSRQDIKTPDEFSNKTEEHQQNLDELEQAVNRKSHDTIKLTGVGQKFGRRNHLMGMFQTANKNYMAAEISRLDVVEEFEKASVYAQNSNIDSVVTNLDNFVTFYTNEKARIIQLSRGDRITELSDEEGFLPLLRRARSPDSGSLRTILFEAIHQGYSILQNANDTRAYAALSSVYYAVMTLLSVMRYLIKVDVYLADESYRNEAVESYNFHIDQALKDFSSFKHLLGQDKVGFLDQTTMLFEKLLNTESLNNTGQYTSAIIKEKIEWLAKQKILLADSGLFGVMKNTPHELKAHINFDEKSLHTPIGQWIDGAEVSYAVQYATEDNNLYSKVGKWSSPLLVHGKSNPIIKLPTHSAYNRLIFRRFNGQKPQLVGIIKPRKQNAFRDIDRDLWNAASGLDEARALNEISRLKTAGANITTEFDLGGSLLHAAASNGNSEVAKFFLQNNSITINAQDENGYTPLHIAAEGGWADFVNLMIDHGGYINAQTRAGSTPLHVAVANGYPDVVSALFRANNVDINAQDNIGIAPLHQVILDRDENLLGILLADNRTNVNLQTIGSITPLHLSTLMNSPEITRKLLQARGMHINAQSDGNMTALHYAAIFGNLPSLLLLIGNNGTNVNAQSVNGWNSLHYAVSMERDDLVCALLKLENLNVDAVGKGQITPLYIAVATNQSAIVKELLDRGAEIDLPDFEGLTVLHLAAINRNSGIFATLLLRGANANAKTKEGSTVLHLLVTRGDLDGIKNVLVNGRGVQVDLPNSDGLTALHLAILANHSDAIELLVDKGANINARTLNGSTILHALAAAGDRTAVQYVLETFPDVQVDLPNDHGLTALHLAIIDRSRNIVLLLEKKGANINARTFNGSTYLHVKAAEGELGAVKNLLRNRNVQLDLLNSEGMNALHLATLNSDLEMMESLLVSGANASARTRNGSTILHLAAATGSLATVRGILEHCPVHCSDVQVDSKNNEGLTALHIAAQKGYLQVVKQLLDRGKAGLTVMNDNMETALLLAERGGYTEVAELLKKRISEATARN